MRYCISPDCPSRQNPDSELHCQTCGSELLLNGKYWTTRLLAKRHFDGICFSSTFEATDGISPIILKVLYDNSRSAVARFRREAKVLSKLKHRGIPTVEPDGYFSFMPENSFEPVHCLVMEKIEGIDLEQWLEMQNNRPIGEDIAINWLRQLAEILEYLHQHQVFHRDIKPSNIMLRQDGQLVLIDFGTAREITQTYDQKAAAKNITIVYSRGYTAPEQENGKSSLQSDFFALGRSFVYLLTGKIPADFSEDRQTGALIWRNSAKVSPDLERIVDKLMAPSPVDRFQNAREILNELKMLQLEKSVNNDFQEERDFFDASQFTNTEQDWLSNNPKNLPLWTEKKWQMNRLVAVALLASVSAIASALVVAEILHNKTTQKFTDVRNVPNRAFVDYGDNPTWTRINNNVNPAINQNFRWFPLRAKSPPTGLTPSDAGIQMLLDGQVTFCQSDRPVNNQEQKIAKQKGFSLQEIPVALDHNGKKIFVIIKDYDNYDNLEEQSGKAYANLLLTTQGQKLVEASGFKPINSRHYRVWNIIILATISSIAATVAMLIAMGALNLKIDNNI